MVGRVQARHRMAQDEFLVMTETTEETPARSPLAERLSSAHVDFRQDLEVSRHVHGGLPQYIIRDPMTFSSHRVSRRDYLVLIRIDKRLALQEIFESIVGDGLLGEKDEELFYEFVISLHRLGFLDLPIPDEKMLFERHMARKSAEKMQRLMSVFFMQVPIWNPNRFLEKTYGVARALFSLPAFVIWVLLQAIALWLAWQNFDELTQPLGQVLIVENVPILWTTLVGLKLIHEFGHAWACKRFGGYVPEMGAYFIVFTPCAYVDATAAWGFSKKFERLVVSLAGMYFELAIAAIAVVVWCMADSVVVKSACYNVIFLASVATLVFNANPMMKSDGYFALSDVLEVPNLRQRATAYSASVFKRMFFGTPKPKDRANKATKLIFLAYGVSLPSYRAGVVLGISMGIAAKLFVVGMVLGITYIAMEIVKVSKKLFSLFFFSAETQAKRWRAATIGVAVITFLPLSLVGVPLPGGIAVSAAVHAEKEFVLRAESGGFLRSLDVQNGDLLRQGQQMATLEFPHLEERLIDARAALETVKLRLRAAEVVNASGARQATARLAASQTELDALNQRKKKQTILAPIDGVFVSPDGRPSLGTWFPKGKSLMRIHSGQIEARTFLTEEQFALARPRVGDPILFRSTRDSDTLVTGVISRVVKRADKAIGEPGLTQFGGGDIAVDPMMKRSQKPYFFVVCLLDQEVGGDLHGGSGRVFFEGDSETIGRKLWRSAINLSNRLRHGSL